MKSPKPQPLQTSASEENNGSFKLPYIQTGASRQEVVELGTKVRELEINLLDIKAQMERRMT
jgi:hypothetical protein